MRAGLLLSLLLGACGSPASEPARPEAIPLLQDTRFERGFTLLAPQPGARAKAGTLIKAGTAAQPAWFVAQWSSRFPITGGRSTSDGLVATNEARWLSVLRTDDGLTSLELGIDSRPEYGGVLRTNSAQPWPHLLVEQDITNCPPLTRIQRMPFALEASLPEASRFEGPGYSPGLHAAQFQFVTTLQNRNPASKGFGDFLWFVVPMYDDRHPVPPLYVARDFADPSAKLIYNPGAAPFTTNSLQRPGWVRFAADLKPHLTEALETAWRKGYLPGSHDPADYRLTSVNLGWEVPGLNRVAVRIRKLSLSVELKAAASAP